MKLGHLQKKNRNMIELNSLLEMMFRESNYYAGLLLVIADKDSLTV